MLLELLHRSLNLSQLARLGWGRSQQRILLSLLLLSLCMTTGCSLPEVSAESRLFAPIALEFVDDYTLPPTVIKDVPVGGLSGLTYDAQKGVFYAVSDDRSQFAPARFYTLIPQLKTDKTTHQLTIKTVDITATTPLLQADGKTYARGTIDAEGIALSPRGTVFISSEGDAQAQIPPSINEYDQKTGQWVKALPIPAAYLPQVTEDGTRQGVQNNKAFEGLTINTDATADLFRVFAAIEQPLEQDRTPPPATSATAQDAAPLPKDKLRILHYALIPSRADLVGEYVYELDPPPVGTIEHGLSEILSWDNAGRFLALERSLGLAGFSSKIYQFTFAGARDVQTAKSLQGLPADWQPVRKQLLLDLSELGVSLDNVEGMALGPKLPDGSPSLWIVSDNNFDKDQVTQFLLFRLKTIKTQP
jgi:hypothetical protein